ncbi:MAG: hypothetical protein KJ958_09900 [Gammaproteobacteria bacterium]|nr:hypothetical protein [Gammaproteobacteria bacterium]MBU1979467.1 hypothetical protein [Gammaproteobacteria bacterium]
MIFSFSLSWNPAHGNSDAGDADPNHLDAEEGGFVSFDGVHFQDDYLSDDVVQSDAHADITRLGLVA